LLKKGHTMKKQQTNKQNAQPMQELTDEQLGQVGGGNDASPLPSGQPWNVKPLPNGQPWNAYGVLGGEPRGPAQEA
jgi:hypothetical protein